MQLVTSRGSLQLQLQQVHLPMAGVVGLVVLQLEQQLPSHVVLQQLPGRAHVPQHRRLQRRRLQQDCPRNWRPRARRDVIHAPC